MKLNTIELTTACAILCVAFCQPIEAKTIRADNGSGGSWNEGSPSAGSPTLSDPTFSGSGLTEVVFTANSMATTDVQNNDVGLAIENGTMYNWSPSSAVSSGLLQSIQGQMIVYTLGTGDSSTNDTATDTLNGSTYNIANGDFEVQVNYCYPNNSCPVSTNSSMANATSASFTFGGSTYSSAAGQGPPDADFLFSTTGAFLGTLSVDDSTGDASFTPPTATSNALGGWTSSPASAPEIDPSSVITALTLLAGALALVRGNTSSRAGRVSNGC